MCGVFVLRPSEKFLHRHVECRDGLPLLNAYLALSQLYTVGGLDFARHALVTRLRRLTDASPFKKELEPVNTASFINRHKLRSGRHRTHERKCSQLFR